MPWPILSAPDSFNFERFDQRVTPNEEEGPRTFRKRTQQSVLTCEATWTIDADILADLEFYYRFGLNRGAKWFAVQLPFPFNPLFPNGPDVAARFLEPYQVTPISSGQWKVECRLEVIEGLDPPPPTVIEYVFTSAPYPLVANEEMEAGHEPLDGGLREGITISTEELETGELEILSGIITTLVKSTSTDVEGVDVGTKQILSGVLSQLLKTYNLPDNEDGVDTNHFLRSGEMKVLLITISPFEPEGLDDAPLEILSGVLT